MKVRRANLHLLRDKNILVPDEKPSKSSIVHFGVGGFHRAHQAVYTQESLKKESFWGITGISIRPEDLPLIQALKSQDYMYTVLSKSPNGNSQLRLINAITSHIDGYNNPQNVTRALINQNLKLITLTITQGTYSINPHDSELIKDIKKLKQSLNLPMSTFWGHLTQGLSLRMQKNLPGLSILSCDNIQHNGDLLKKLLLQFINLTGKSNQLSDWIKLKCSFPNCMVDRITPKSNNQHCKQLLQNYGLIDEAGVRCQSFSQWVIEDNFISVRPEWPGSMFVKDVLPYESLKLRVLNASHQALCYIGMLRGHNYVHEAINDFLIYRFIKIYLQKEVTPTLDSVPGISIEKYQQTVLNRFTNPAIADTLIRISENASDRIKVFNLPIINNLLKKNTNIQLQSSALIIASWMKYIEVKQIKGQDSLSEQLMKVMEDVQQQNQPNIFIQSFPSIFKGIAENKCFNQAVASKYNQLSDKGIQNCLKQFL